MGKISFKDSKSMQDCEGIIEFIIKDRKGNVIDRITERNVVKIFAKEMLSHRLPSSQLWDPQANSGNGGWVNSNIDPTEEFSARYVLFGASFDENYIPLDQNDPRFYASDSVTGSIVPIRLTPGAYYEGGLINAIPISESGRPLKRIEEVEYQPTYQPSGNPLLQEDVRALNNVIKFKTTLLSDEYNGMGLTESDFFTITEVALAGGRKFDSVNDCECTPRVLFLEGIPGTLTDNSGSGSIGEIPILATANGGDVVSIDPSVSNVNLIKQGDQIKLVGRNDSKSECSISQISPYYLVLSKLVGGRDMQLDRTPLDTNGNVIAGEIGLYRDTLRLFSHRIISVPIKKASNFEIIVIWTIIFN